MAGILPMRLNELPDCWRAALHSEFQQPYFSAMQEFVAQERRQCMVFPSDDDVLNALRLTPLKAVRVVILGQDPYHNEGQAHGLSFSVPRGVLPPPSLQNIFRELHEDLGIPRPSHGSLESWARQGVLLLNAVLTVRAHTPNSHRKRGWEQFTDRILQIVNLQPHVVFVLWGNSAQKKARLIDSRHRMIMSAHPSPLSARRGFLGSRPFSQINHDLTNHGLPPVNWQLPTE